MEVDNKNTTRKRKGESIEVRRSARKDKQPFEVSDPLLSARSICIALESCSAPWKFPCQLRRSFTRSEDLRLPEGVDSPAKEEG
jgi:hypothetical protein